MSAIFCKHSPTSDTLDRLDPTVLTTVAWPRHGGRHVKMQTYNQVIQTTALTADGSPLLDTYAALLLYF